MADQELPLDEYHRAGLEITKGNPAVYKSLYSRSDDVTLANPFGAPVRGWTTSRRRWIVPPRITETAKSLASRT